MSWPRGFLLLLVLLPSAARGQQTMLVHLPSAPVEAASRQAEAVTALASYLSGEVPDLTLEAKIFRRLSDAEAFLAESGESVALVLADASLALDFPRELGLVPAYRLVRGGRPTYHRLLVVRGDRAELARLADLRGRSLSVVETAGASSGEFLKRRVFEDELDPADWFGALEPVADDFSATANVLYGQSDAALVAEHNPLLARHLGQELLAVFESPELSLPVLALSEAAFEPARRRAALARALDGLTDDPEGQKVLAELAFDGFEAMSESAGSALLNLPARRLKKLEIAAPAAGVLALPRPSAPGAETLPFALALELPELELELDLPGQ